MDLSYFMTIIIIIIIIIITVIIIVIIIIQISLEQQTWQDHSLSCNSFKLVFQLIKMTLSKHACICICMEVMWYPQ